MFSPPKLNRRIIVIIVKAHLFTPPVYLPPSENVWEVPEVRKFPKSTDLPEEVSAFAVGRLPGV